MRRTLSVWKAALSFRAAARMVPHPAKAAKGGEDSWFVAGGPQGGVGDSRLSWGEGSCTALGVFDGVGGWADSGVDPGLYSKSLARECVLHYDPALAPELVLKRAYVASQHITGTSTACVVKLRDDALETATFGDSCVLVFRDGKLLFRQDAMQSGFNCPAQMGTGAEFSASFAQPWRAMAQPGDLIVAATDGVLDNLFDAEIQALALAPGVTLPAMANAIAQSAVTYARSPRDSPFVVHARQAGINWFRGGKEDDVCVVCARVSAD